jgi:hypothetical protein
MNRQDKQVGQTLARSRRKRSVKVADKREPGGTVLAALRALARSFRLGAH